VKIWAGLLAGLGLMLACSWTSAPPPKFSGRDLAHRLGCLACHSLGGQGGAIASPLDGVGARLSPGELSIMLTHPRQLRPKVKMPSYAYLRPQEQQALIEFLLSLK
jgi:cbb3-type cytochrome oxidase cytochrome c subunit